jgi:uncharacterized protein YdeI (YjbR/CyaY-like superfamily)
MSSIGDGPKPNLFCKNSREWRAWLSKGHDGQSSIWLVFLKGDPVHQQLTYQEALDEALYYGWIDSLIKRIDDSRYARKFSVRKQKSKWSEINKRRVDGLTQAGKMKPPGLSVVEAAKANGCWDKLDRQPVQKEIPPALLKELRKNRNGKGLFYNLTPSHRTRYIMWIATAKRDATIKKRVKEAMALLEEKKELGLR